MFQEVVWTERAVKEIVAILEYWIKRNKSDTYSLKLDREIKKSLNIIAKSSEAGKPTDVTSVRIKIVRDYLIYYRIRQDHIEVITIWDSRRNPKKFEL